MRNLQRRETLVTPQEAFNKVWDWFIVQKKPLGQHGGDAMFFTPDGCRCAIGIFLPPDLVLTDIQQKFTAVHLRRERDCVDKALKGLEDDFVGRLQAAHDSCVFSGKRIYDTLRALAKYFSLQIPNAEEIKM
jgi:hypothetical protein